MIVDLTTGMFTTTNAQWPQQRYFYDYLFISVGTNYYSHLQTQHVYSTVKQRGNDRFNVEYTWYVFRVSIANSRYVTAHPVLGNTPARHRIKLK